MMYTHQATPHSNIRPRRRVIGGAQPIRWRWWWRAGTLPGLFQDKVKCSPANIQSIKLEYWVWVVEWKTINDTGYLKPYPTPMSRICRERERERKRGKEGERKEERERERERERGRVHPSAWSNSRLGLWIPYVYPICRGLTIWETWGVYTLIVVAQ